MNRPEWTSMHQLPINQDCMATDLCQTERLFDLLMNAPSSVPPRTMSILRKIFVVTVTKAALLADEIN